MDLEQNYENIKSRLSELGKADAACTLFGASSHNYMLNNVLNESDVAEFENKFNVKLPPDYRGFLIHVGNGGAGPYYGLQPLEDSLFVDLDYKRDDDLLDPSVPFPFSAPWNKAFEGDESEYEAFEEQYYHSKWETGLLRICNYGCGISMNLVVNGTEYGHIWVDDRGNDGGIYPDPFFDQTGRTKFIEWYNLWLDKSLEELKRG